MTFETREEDGVADPLADPVTEAAPEPGLARPLRVSVAERFDAFPDWPRSDRMGAAACHVFQCADLLEIWLDTIGEARGTRVALVGVHDAGGRPVMLLPLGIERRHGARTLGFLDGTICDYTQPVLFPPAARLDAEAMRGLWRAMRAALPRFDLALFDKMPAEIGGIANPLMHLGTVRMAESGHAMTLAGTAEALEARLPVRSSHRRLRRQLAREMPVALAVAQTGEEARAFLDHVIETKTRKFAETRVPGFELPGKLAFYEEATRRLAAAAPVHLSAIRAGETVIASHWGLVAGGRFHNVLSGYSDGPWRRYAPGRMLNDDLVRWAHAHGARVFDFGIGDEAYKDEYCDVVIPLHRATLPVTWRGRLCLRLDDALTRLRASALWQRIRPYKWVLLRARERMRRG